MVFLCKAEAAMGQRLHASFVMFAQEQFKPFGSSPEALIKPSGFLSGGPAYTFRFSVRRTT